MPNNESYSLNKGANASSAVNGWSSTPGLFPARWESARPRVDKKSSLVISNKQRSLGTVSKIANTTSEAGAVRQTSPAAFLMAHAKPNKKTTIRRLQKQLNLMKIFR
jgi:hypothetical protein